MNEQPAITGRTFAPNVAPPLQNRKNDTQPVIVGTAAKTPPKSDDNEPGPKLLPENETIPPLNSRVNVPSHRGYVTPPIVGECAHCQQPLPRKSRNGRLPQYCNDRCRVARWRQSKKEAEAGGGRVVVFMALVVVAVALWWFWPFLADVAATRPRLPEPVETTVPVIMPTAVPFHPQPLPAETAVLPQTVLIIPNPPNPGKIDPGGVIVRETAVPETAPLPTAVPATVVPAAVDPDQEGQGGGTFTLTTGEIVAIPTAEFYATCAYNQANGRRARPDCPPNAADMLGSGR